MKIGDPVIVYTHEQTGDQHYTIDRIAVVTQVDPEGVPLGVHILDTNAKAPAPFDPDLPPPERRVGLTYMRAAGEPAPDLAAYFNDPEVPGYVAPIEEAPPEEPAPENAPPLGVRGAPESNLGATSGATSPAPAKPAGLSLG